MRVGLYLCGRFCSNRAPCAVRVTCASLPSLGVHEYCLGGQSCAIHLARLRCARCAKAQLQIGRVGRFWRSSSPVRCGESRSRSSPSLFRASVAEKASRYFVAEYRASSRSLFVSRTARPCAVRLTQLDIASAPRLLTSGFFSRFRAQY